MGDEAPIQRACLDWLETQQVVHWRCALGGIRLARGGRRRNPMRGFPDIAGIIPNSDGRFFVVECKAPKGKLEPEQIAWRDRLMSQGVLYALAVSVDDVVSALSDYLPNARPDPEKGAAI